MRVIDTDDQIEMGIKQRCCNGMNHAQARGWITASNLINVGEMECVKANFCPFCGKEL